MISVVCGGASVQDVAPMMGHACVPPFRCLITWIPSRFLSFPLHLYNANFGVSDYSKEQILLFSFAGEPNPFIMLLVKKMLL